MGRVIESLLNQWEVPFHLLLKYPPAQTVAMKIRSVSPKSQNKRLSRGIKTVKMTMI